MSHTKPSVFLGLVIVFSACATSFRRIVQQPIAGFGQEAGLEHVDSSRQFIPLDDTTLLEETRVGNRVQRRWLDRRDTSQCAMGYCTIWCDRNRLTPARLTSEPWVVAEADGFQFIFSRDDLLHYVDSLGIVFSDTRFERDLMMLRRVKRNVRLDAAIGFIGKIGFNSSSTTPIRCILREACSTTFSTEVGCTIVTADGDSVPASSRSYLTFRPIR